MPAINSIRKAKIFYRRGVRSPKYAKLGDLTLLPGVHSVFIVCTGDIGLLFKILLKFRNVLRHNESRSSLACSQNIKDNISTALEVLLF